MSILVGASYIQNLYHQEKGGIYVSLNAFFFAFLAEQMSNESNK